MMQNNVTGKADQLLKEQIAFDKLLDRLDRQLFFLSERINYEHFKQKLAGTKYKETAHGSIESSYNINWDYSEKVIPLKTSFQMYADTYLIKNQRLSFSSWEAAAALFELFKSNSQWDFKQEPNDNPRAFSKDGRYAVSLMRPNEESHYFGNATFDIFLIYKDR